MLTDPSHDPGVDDVVAWLSAKKLRTLVADGVRQAIDEVIDGPRTGRWSVDELEKTEKIYIGTKVEIVVRTALGLERAGRLDTIIEGHFVDFKWSSTSSWEFPTEAIGEICLLIGAKNEGTQLDIGVIRVVETLLSPGRNKDWKAKLSQLGRSAIRWLERDVPLKPSFLATLDAGTREEILAGRRGQDRVRRLFQLLPRQPIPRLAIATLAQQDDPTRRTRLDTVDRLGGMRVLSARRQRARLEHLGFTSLASDEFVGIPADELDS